MTPVLTDVTTRAEFQALVVVRLEEAQLLLDAGKWDGAYYLAGYALELALKVCIIKLLMETDKFPERKFTDRCSTHSVVELLALTGLRAKWDAAADANAKLKGYWEKCKEWNEGARYERISEALARTLYEAISDPTDGVLTWIKQQW
jgi:HEPN domain-containing protein